MTIRILKNTLAVLAFVMLTMSTGAASAGVASLAHGSINIAGNGIDQPDIAPIKVRNHSYGHNNGRYYNQPRYYDNRRYYNDRRRYDRRRYYAPRRYYGNRRYVNPRYYGGRRYYGPRRY